MRVLTLGVACNYTGEFPPERAVLNQQPKPPVISIKEARKLLGKDGDHLTDGDLADLISQSEQVLRYIFRLYGVHKKAMVE